MIYKTAGCLFEKQPLFLYFVSTGGAHRGFGGNDSVTYWQCEEKQDLQEKLRIPLSNEFRESAMLEAAIMVIIAAILKERQSGNSLIHM